MTELTLPFPPSLNKYYGCRGHAKYVKDSGDAYRVKVYGIVHKMGVHCYNVPIKVFVNVAYPDNRQRDLDNYMKALLDSLTIAGLWTDDSLIHELHIFKVPSVSKGSITLTVEEL